jgi:hypothetical protein
MKHDPMGIGGCKHVSFSLAFEYVGDVCAP